MDRALIIYKLEMISSHIKKDNMRIYIKGDLYFQWSDFINLGGGVADNVLDEIMEEQTPNECCIITYPTIRAEHVKGSMISHDNFTWVSRQCVSVLNILETKERIISYIPLYRVTFQLFDIMIPLTSAGTTCYLRNQGDPTTFAKHVRPTTFICIPAVLESMEEEITKTEKSFSNARQCVIRCSKQIGLKGTNKSKWIMKPWGWSIAYFLLFRKMRYDLGLSECKCCLSCSSKLSKETLQFFMSCGLPIFEMYGMCESTGVLTSCLPGSVQSGSVGRPIPESKIIIHNPDIAGNGEVCFYERNLFMGYLNQEMRTKDSLNEQDMFLTGDIGYRDNEDFLYLTGNTRDKITTSGGDVIHPVPVEEAIKQTHTISDCMLIGDNRPYLTLLATLTDNKLRSDERGELMDDESVKNIVQQTIRNYNTTVASSERQIRACYLLDSEFSVEHGESTFLFKAKIRHQIEENYKTEIEKMYEVKPSKVGINILRKDNGMTSFKEESE